MAIPHVMTVLHAFGHDNASHNGKTHCAADGLNQDEIWPRKRDLGSVPGFGSGVENGPRGRNMGGRDWSNGWTM